MSLKMKEIRIGLGAPSGSITKQLAEQGCAFADERLGQHFDNLKHSLLSLVFAGVVTDSQRSKIEQKLSEPISDAELQELLGIQRHCGRNTSANSIQSDRRF